jgi:hypothetical protein
MRSASLLDIAVCVNVGRVMRHNHVGSRRTTAGYAGLVALALVLAVGCEEEEGGDPPGTSGTGAGGPGGGGPGGDCGPNSADTPCTACLKTNCCDAWKACRAEAACTTCSDCLGSQQDVELCDVNTCVISGTDSPTAQLLTCGLTGCEMECGY